MKQKVNNHNNIFTYAIFGVLLFIAAMGFTLLNFKDIRTFELSSVATAGMLGAASVSLLYRAIKADRERLQI